jgi:hypothetical protein
MQSNGDFGVVKVRHCHAVLCRALALLGLLGREAFYLESSCVPGHAIDFTKLPWSISSFLGQFPYRTTYRTVPHTAHTDNLAGSCRALVTWRLHMSASTVGVISTFYFQ